MKKLTALLTAYVLFLGMNANAQWIQLPNGMGTNMHVSALAFNGTNIFAGTIDSGIYLSTNYGTNWTKTTMSYRYIRSLAVNGNNVFAGTNGIGVYHSSDNGSSWYHTTLGNFVVIALAISGGYVSATTYVSGPGEMPGIYLSTNNGSNWTKKMENSYGYVCSLGANGDNIFAGNYNGGIYLSTNRGVNWGGAGLNDKGVYCIAFRDYNVFAGTYAYGVYISSNNGTNWTQTALNDETIGSLAVSGNNIFAVIGSGVMLSTNNGSSWLQINSGFNTSPSIGPLLIINNYLYAGTTKSVWRLDLLNPPSIPVLISPDNYSTENLLNLNLVWRKTNSANEYNVVLATDSTFSNIVLDTLMKDTVKAITNLSPAKDYYWKIRTRIVSIWGPFGSHYTFRTCSPWFPMHNGITNNNVNAFAANGTNIFVGTSGGVFSSTNNGTNWTAVNNGLTNLNVKALFVDGSNLFAGTEGGGVFLSGNNGGFWIAVNGGLYSQSIRSFVKSGSNLYAGTSGGVFRSNNNGGNWQDAGLNYTDINSLYLNGSVIYAGTSNGLYFTANNGTNWNTTFGTMNVNSIAISGSSLFVGTTTGVFLSTNNGNIWSSNWLSNQNVHTLKINGNAIFAGTDSGGVFLSANNGTNWVERNQGFNTIPSVRSFLTIGNYIYAGTFGQKVWRRDLTYVIGISTISNLVPKTYSLSQNYPNPFNPTTKIRFDIPMDSRLRGNDNIMLKIFDVLGREVAVLVNEQLKPGTYEADWNASSFPSGVYFYRLRTEKFSETKRMVLIK